ncbi:MAG: phage holin family protein [Symbiobacteriia bacterium]
MTLQQFTGALLQALYPVLLATLTAAAGILAQRLNAWLRVRLSSEQLFLAQQIAGQAVQFTDQVYKGLHGPDKLAVALARAKDAARGHGINYTDEQWTTLIEQAVNSFNRAWVPLSQPPAAAPTPAAVATEASPPALQP